MRSLIIELKLHERKSNHIIREDYTLIYETDSIA